MNYTIYLKDTGRVVATLECSDPEGAAAQANAAYGVIAGSFSDGDTYVLEGVATPRPTMPLSGVVSLELGQKYTFEGLPAGTEVEFDGIRQPLEGTMLELEGDCIATYQLVFHCFPYLSHAMEVTVHAS